MLDAIKEEEDRDNQLKIASDNEDDLSDNDENHSSFPDTKVKIQHFEGTRFVEN